MLKSQVINILRCQEEINVENVGLELGCEQISADETISNAVRVCD